MANELISALTLAGSVTGSEDIPVNLAGNDYRVTPAQIVTYSQEFAPNGAGIYSCAGSYVGGPGGKHFILSPSVIQAGQKIYTKSQTDIVSDLTTLTTATWYAIAMSEVDGTLSAIKAGAAGGWLTWAISGNQLAMYTIFNSAYNYCRDSISGTFYRILGVFFSNTSSPYMGYKQDIANYPLSHIYAYSTGTVTGITVSINTINFDVIGVDINSECVTGANWAVTPKVLGGQWNVSSATLLASTLWTAGKSSAILIYKNATVGFEYLCYITQPTGTFPTGISGSASINGSGW